MHSNIFIKWISQGLHPNVRHRLDSKNFVEKLSSAGRGGVECADLAVLPVSSIGSEDFEHKFDKIAAKISDSIERCEMRTEEQEKHDENQLEWKKVALVCDRCLFWVFAMCTAISTTLILFSSPHGPSLLDLKHHIFG